MIAQHDLGSYLKRLQALLSSQGAAYGFALTVWGTGSLARDQYSPFTIDRVFLFILGPLLMYACLLVTLYRPGQLPVVLANIRYTLFGFLDFLSVPLAVGTGFLVYSLVHQPIIGIPLGSFLATLVYNLLLGTQLLLFGNRASRSDL